jgi:hypothetical protein
MSSKLFSYGSVKNKPARSGFDWSEHFSFTAKAGELLPVYWKFLLPGTKVNLNLSSFSRTMPVNTAAYTRVKEYYDWYFVPFRLINKSLGQALVQMQDQPVQATSLLQNKTVTLDLPWTTCGSMFTLLDYASTTLPGLHKDKNLNGFSKAATTAKLLRYLRFGNCYYTSTPAEMPTNKNFGLSSKNEFNLLAAKDTSFNILPLAAYQKIYCDHFRFEQWENACPYTYNFDYYNGGNVFTSVLSNPKDFWSNDNILSLRYANYNKDLFMGVMPSSQFGSVAMVVINNTGDATSNYLYLRNLSVTGRPTIVTASSTSNPMVFKQNAGDVVVGNSIGVTVSSLRSVFDILSFRIAEATQKWKEVTQCAKQGYKEQLEAHFNVKLSEALSDHCRYIGGTSSGITISEVLNTNLESGDANIKGKGVGGSFGSETFETNEHGILMCIYHAVPVLDYLRSGQDLQLLHTLATDLPIPEFDHIGMEALPVESFFNEQSTEGLALMNNIPVLGYVPRYVAYKTSVDWVSGAFETTLDTWVAPLTIDQQMSKLLFAPESGSVFSMNYGFFKVTPMVLDSIFVTPCDDTWDTDQFLVNVAFNVKPVQNLDYNGMPY